MLQDDVAASRAQIFAVLQKSKFSSSLLEKVDKIYAQALRVLLKHLENIGKLAVEYAIEKLEESAMGSGIEYVYVDEHGGFVRKHQASLPGDAPAKAHGDLIKAISYRPNPDGWVEVGVFDDIEGGWPTVAYLGKGNKTLQDQYGSDVKFVRAGGETHNLRKYAFYLEYGTSKMQPRPFLAPAMEQAVSELRKELYATMRKEISKVMGRKNAPVYFRLKVKN